MWGMADEASHLGGLPAETAHCGLDELVSYRSGDLSAERAQVFEQHVQSCPACRRRFRDAAAVLSDVDTTIRKAASRANPVDALLLRLQRKAADDAARPRGHTPRQPSQRFWLPVAGVVAVVTLVAVLQLVLALLPRYWHGFGGAAQPARIPAGPLVGPRPP